ncbi:recQ-mediated genome instability protein 2 isoform X2 [Lepidochelys kempii]|uniref:recQ-mediated genome instability protein 2 isoform X2 n=1 Tax=Lepidochelys kempii TaxID=8472 RepID=UPI003C6F12C6
MAGEPRSPPVKVLAAQLKRCRRAAGGPWLLGREEAGQGPLAVPVVWMQGTVLAVEAGGARGGSARLQDESGPFTVLGVERVPKGRPCLSAGRNAETKFLDTLNDCFLEQLVHEPTKGVATLHLLLSGAQDLVREESM